MRIPTCILENFLLMWCTLRWPSLITTSWSRLMGEWMSSSKRLQVVGLENECLQNSLIHSAEIKNKNNLWFFFITICLWEETDAVYNLERSRPAGLFASSQIYVIFRRADNWEMSDQSQPTTGLYSCVWVWVLRNRVCPRSHSPPGVISLYISLCHQA